MLTRRAFLKTSAGGLAGATLWQFGCGGGGGNGGGSSSQVAGIYGVGEAYLSFDDSGDVFEIQSAAHTVLRRRTDGSVVWQVGEFGMGPGQLNYPTALLRDRQGQIYVVDHGNSRIQVYGADGAYLQQIGGRTADDVDDPMELDFCRAVAVDKDQRLYVCDTRDYQIQLFERDGTPAGAFGSFGDMGQDPESLNNPIALAIDGDGDVHIVDQGNYRVQVFHRDGTYVRSYGGYGDGPGQFLLPRSIAIDDNGRSYVADAAGFRISVFESDGEPMDEIEVRFDDLRLGSPLQLTWAPDEQLYVTAVPTSLT